MRFFRASIWLCLIPLCSGQRLFLQEELTTEGWTPINHDQYKSLVACSFACKSSYPQCKAFTFDKIQGCRHGLLKSPSGLPERVFVESKELAKFRVWQQSGETFENFMSFYNIHHVGQKLFVAIQHFKTYEEGRVTCQDMGGKLATSIREQDVWQYFAKLTMSREYWWVGLSSTGNATCTDEECNAKWVWDDGKPYQHESFMTCSAQIRETASGMVFVGQSTACNQQLALTDDLKGTKHWNEDAKKVRIWPLCEFDV